MFSNRSEPSKGEASSQKMGLVKNALHYRKLANTRSSFLLWRTAGVCYCRGCRAAWLPIRTPVRYNGAHRGFFLMHTSPRETGKEGITVVPTGGALGAEPPKASMLYALEAPRFGGDTYFNNMYGAYESLPEELKRRIEGLSLKHDGTYNSGGYLRQGVTPVDDPMISPGFYHPLVCTHPETRRRALYLGRRRNAYIGGLSLAESESLLEKLWSYATRAGLAWGHKWRAGDLVLWDNRCTMHRRDSFDAASRRIMHRTQIRDEVAPRA